LSSGPDEIGKKQNDYKGAPGLELLEEARQNVTKYKNLKTVRESRSEEPR
jgi:hypothetical protein